MAVAVPFLGGCENSSLGPPEPASAGVVRSGDPAISVLTWNVYVGADLSTLLEPGGFLPGRVATVFGQVQATDAAGRAEAMARAIGAAPPDLIGLQEVARYRIQSPGDFLDSFGQVQNPIPNAQTEVFDFLDLLIEALAVLGHDYVIASRTETFDVELPMFTGAPQPPWSDLRLTESVAILARADVDWTNPRGDVFDVNLPVSVAGFDIDIVKGWASVDATVKGRTYRFLTTHLEPASGGRGRPIVPELALIQHAQATEVLAELEGVELPVILAGDLNSEPGGTSTATYALMTGVGFLDTWLVGRARGDGFTANQSADLRNSESELWHRIDFVLYRDPISVSRDLFTGSVQAGLLGAAQADRTMSGLWPSDHAGVVATLRSAPRAAR